MVPVDSLIAFVSIAENGSINRAARALNTSQPSLTRIMQQLENAIGGPLFDRSSKGVTLTSLGQSLFSVAQSVRTEAARAQRTIELLRQKRHDEFHVGLVPGQHPLEILTQAIVDFTGQNPRPAVHLHLGTLPELLGKLREGRLEVVVGPSIGDQDPRSIVTERLYYDMPELCCRAEHPLARREISTEDLVRADWVLGPADGPSRQQLSEIIPDPAKPRIKVEVENVLIRLELVQRSNLLSIFDAHHVSSAIANGHLVRLPLNWSRHRRPMGIFRSAQPSKLSRLFVKALRARYASSGLPVR